METLEVNKLVGAILVGGLVAMVTGAVAHMLVAPKHHEGGEMAAISSGAAPEPSAAPAPAALEPVSPLLAKADPHKGQQIAMKCQACHDFTKGGPNKIGPNLWGIVGSKPAEVPGYSFSDAMKAREDKPWTYEALSDFLAAPRSFVPGTKMTFAGLPKVEDRADVIAYLRTLADSPLPLPSAADIAAATKPVAAAQPAAAPAATTTTTTAAAAAPAAGTTAAAAPAAPAAGTTTLHRPLPPRAPRPPHRPLPRASPPSPSGSRPPISPRASRSRRNASSATASPRAPPTRSAPISGASSAPSRRRSRATPSPTP